MRHTPTVLRPPVSAHTPTVGEVIEIMLEHATAVTGEALRPIDMLHDKRFILITYLTLRCLGVPAQEAKNNMHGESNLIANMRVQRRMTASEIDTEVQCAMRFAARAIDQTRRAPCYLRHRSKYDGRRRTLLASESAT